VTLRAAIYMRVSTSGQEESGSSLDTQESACRTFATEHGCTISPAHIYRETFSGIELWDRPQLTKMRAAIRAKEVDRVVCYAIDRLSRDPVHLGVILSEAEHAGVPVEFVTEPLDDSPEG
jgi:site-specific DNA recombinase